MKNPFNAIIGLSSLVERDIDTLSIEELLDMASMIHDSSQYAHGLLENLLEWALVQTGTLQFNPQKINLTEHLKPILAITASNATTKKQMVNCNVAQDCVVYADAQMLETILLNLISNAIKFTPPNGEINIRAANLDSSTSIEIVDNGIGIEPEVMSTLFDIDHMKSTNGTENEHGTGLGLILCRELVERHDGRLSVSSNHGKGTIFTINLPDKTEQPD